MFTDINIFVSDYLNSFMSNEVFSYIAIFLADAPIFFLPAFLVFLWFYYNNKNQNDKKENLIYIFYSTFVSLIINLFIQLFYKSERPSDFSEISQVLALSNIPENSFPSDHSSISISFALALYLFWYKKTSLVFSFFAILMLISRVMVWVHWIFDIIAWILIWLLSAYLVFSNKDIAIFRFSNKLLLKIANIFKL